jgi:nucleotide-binding universal stress UspA family protein
MVALEAGMDGKQILVPIDGSDVAEAALPYADEIARLRRAPLLLFAVVDQHAAPALTAASGELRAHVERITADGLAAYLSVTAQRLRDRGLEVATEVAAGDPAEAIGARAVAVDAALIVMASHGRGGVHRLILGSVADKVMRAAACPVLIVAPPGEPGARAGGPVTLRRLLVPLDGSTLAEAALPVAGALAQQSGASLTLMRVEPWVSTMYGGLEPIPNFADVDEGVVEAAREYLARVKEGLPAGGTAWTVVQRGNPAANLLEFVLNEEPDLVVMTTHGRGGVKRFLLGSIADRLVRCGAPVLLVPPPTAERTGRSDLEADLVANGKG